MNIFATSQDPYEAAQMLCNRHVVKMTCESAQILSTAIFLRDSALYGQYACCLYKPTHKHHPCVRWAMATSDNFDWLVKHSLEMCDEYTRRYNRVHASRRVIENASEFAGGQFYSCGNFKNHSSFVQAMPEKYRCTDAVQAYRNYYVGEKAKFAAWEPRAKVPEWWPIK